MEATSTTIFFLLLRQSHSDVQSFCVVSIIVVIIFVS